MPTEQSANVSPLRGALIGFGNVAVQAHLPAWQRNDRFRIDAVVDPDPGRAELAARLLPEARLYSTIDSCLAEDTVDFVDICTPPCFHAELMLSACRAGKHVFCEKPLKASSQEIYQIGCGAEECSKVIFVVNNWKYAPLWDKAIGLIREGRIGRVREATLSVLRTPGSGGGLSDWRRCLDTAGGGILLDHGWHNIYLLLALVGESPLSISARMETNGSDLEEIADLTLRFTNAEARLHMSWRADARRNHGMILGDRGTLAINDDHLLLSDAQGGSPTRFQFAEALSAGSHHVEWMTPVVDSFYREIAGLSPKGENFTEARWCAHLVDLAYQSYREGSVFLPVKDPAAS